MVRRYDGITPPVEGLLEWYGRPKFQRVQLPPAGGLEITKCTPLNGQRPPNMSHTTSLHSTEPIQVLVFTKTVGYRHDSIPAGIAALAQLSTNSLRPPSSPSPGPISSVPFVTHATEEAEIFSPSTLAPFAVIVLLNSSGNFLSGPQLAALREYVHGGGGVVGVHCATTGMLDSEDDPDFWYSRLLGAKFDEHPVPQRGIVRVADSEHGIMKGTIGNGQGKWWTGRGDRAGEDKTEGEAEGDHKTWRWEWFDEWYNFKENPALVGDLHVLLSVDEESYAGGKHGESHPIAWCQDFEGGRSFYTALGHFDDAYQDSAFMGQLLNGILWAARIIE